MARKGKHSYRRRPLGVLFCLAALVLLTQGCATLKPYNPPTAGIEDQVQVPVLPGVRAWGDEPNPALQQSALESLEQEKAANHGVLPPVVYGLALSGGGQDGAFGAGILCGWSEKGTRPQFKLVTGISTGSLMAPFAFLGPAYDHILKVMRHLRAANTIPQLLKSFDIIRKFKGLNLFFRWTSTVPYIRFFPNIDGNNQRFGIDYSKFSCFNYFVHGLYSFPWVFNQLANWQSARKSIAFLIGLTTFYNIASSVMVRGGVDPAGILPVPAQHPCRIFKIP